MEHPNNLFLSYSDPQNNLLLTCLGKQIVFKLSAPPDNLKTKCFPRQVKNKLFAVYWRLGRNNKLNGVHFKQLIDGSLIIGEEHSESSKMDSSDKQDTETVRTVENSDHVSIKYRVKFL